MVVRPPFSFVVIDTMRRCINLLFFLFSSGFVCAQDDVIRVLFYNTENLFDTIDAPDTFDEDYTPAGKLQHSAARYALKLKHLGKVIDSSFNGASPELLGLCEVENLRVLEGLRSNIGVPHHLAIIHFESPDRRGIDNALMYDTIQFSILHAGLRRIELGGRSESTRGILWAVLKENYTEYPFLVLVNHWPSRYGGREASNEKRMIASRNCMDLIDSVSQEYPECSVLLMGDLNDHPDDESVLQLSKCDDPKHDPCLVNMHEQYLELDAGSHVYRSEWAVLDHILVNRRLLYYHSWSPDPRRGDFVWYDWMMYENKRDHRLYPNRFYGSSAFYGGYSDHLPARLELHLPK